VVAELVDVDCPLARRLDRLGRRPCERLGAVAADDAERHVPAPGDGQDDAADCVFLAVDVNLDALAVPQVAPVGRGGVLEHPVELSPRLRLVAPPGAVDDVVVADVPVPACRLPGELGAVPQYRLVRPGERDAAPPADERGWDSRSPRPGALASM